MSIAFPLKSTDRDTIFELPDAPANFTAVLQLLYDQRYQGQVLIDFHRGLPRVISIPELHRIPLAREKPPSSA